MRITTTQDNHTIIHAEEGFFLTNNNGVYGTEIYLGDLDSPENYEELSLSQWPDENPEEPIEVPIENDLGEIQYDIPDTLEEAKERKLELIKLYDISDNVNGFFYNDQFMWLDRVTRAVLANTINSAELLNQNTINIWYNDIVCVTLNCEEAKYLLAMLEMYATVCYNVTATHKQAVRNMTTIEQVVNFDITADYPERLRFPLEQ